MHNSSLRCPPSVIARRSLHYACAPLSRSPCAEQRLGLFVTKWLSVFVARNQEGTEESRAEAGCRRPRRHFYCKVPCTIHRCVVLLRSLLDVAFTTPARPSVVRLALNSAWTFSQRSGYRSSSPGSRKERREWERSEETTVQIPAAEFCVPDKAESVEHAECI